MTLLARASRRYLLRHPWQIGLATLGVALGVAVVVSIDLANESATRGFELSTAATLGKATHQVTGPPGGLDESVYRALRLRGIAPAAPVVEGTVRVGDRALRLIGVDPFSEGPFGRYFAGATGASRAAVDAAVPIATLLTHPGALVLTRETAAALGLAPGATFAVRAGTGTKTALLAGTLEPQGAGARAALADVALCDIAVAQELLGLEGKLSRIDLIAPAPGAASPPAAAWEETVRAAVGPGAALAPTAARSGTALGMTRAFRINLQALSLLALVCGTFLIYNTITFSVVQRRPLIGLLRAAGVTRGEIFRLVLGEAARVGVVGTAAGVGLGIVLGQGLLALVTRTINDLYYATSVRQVALTPFGLGKGALLGLGATLLAALPPALEATLAPPRATLSRSVIEERARRAVPRAAAAGLVLLLAGGLVLLLPTQDLVVAFVALFFVLVGCALVTPLATVGLSKAAVPPLSAALGTVGRMAARGPVRALSRTAVAVAALVIAVSVTVGMGTMIRSFRVAVVEWLEATLQSDVYVSAGDVSATRSDEPLPADAVRRIAALPGLASVSLLRGVVIDTPAGPLRLNALRIGPTGERTFRFVEGDPRAVWSAVHGGGAVIVSEPYAYRHGVHAGASVTLPTAAGPRAFPVAGVFTSYASDQGVVMLDMTTYRAHWNDDTVSALGLFAAPGTDPDALAARVRATAGPGQDLLVQSNRTLRDTSLQIFDRTFTITSVLRLLATLVAFIGMLTALLAMQLERARELAVLRANGLTPGQLWQLVVGETGLMGLVAGLLAIPVGLVQAALMIYVINRRSFGWTLPLSIGPSIAVEAVLLALAAALLAGLYPAWRMARTSPALALREE